MGFVPCEPALDRIVGSNAENRIERTDGDSIEKNDQELIRIRREKRERLLNTMAERTQPTVEPPRAMPDQPVLVTDQTMKAVLNAYPNVVVDCWAPWCGPCRYIAPVIEALAKDYTGTVVFGKLDVDQNPMAAQQFGIMSIPTLLIFKNGRFVDAVTGAMPRHTLEPILRAKLGLH